MTNVAPPPPRSEVVEAVASAMLLHLLTVNGVTAWRVDNHTIVVRIGDDTATITLLGHPKE